MRALPLSLLLPLALVACDPTEPEESTSTGPTWSADVAPIVAEHCAGCHSEGGVAFSLEYYDLAHSMASAMAEQTAAGTMPPWGEDETEDCQPRYGFVDDLRLSDEEKATIAAWADAGAPEGDPKTATTLPEPPDLRMSDIDVELTPLTAYDASGPDDQFICFVLDPALAEDSWLTGLQIVPGTTEVVHHVLVFSDPEGKSADNADANGRYECFGGAGTGGVELIGAWAPGSLPFVTPEGSGIPLSAGSLLVMQVHYHPHGLEAAPDLTTVQLQLTDTAPSLFAALALVGNADGKRSGLLSGPNDRTDRPEFRIPADVAGHTESMEFTVDSGPYPIWSVGTHMHYLGTDMVISLDHAAPEGDEPSSECLVQTPAYDYNWQRTYRYDAPLDAVPTIRAGDTLRMTCTYDNTLNNPGVVQALSDAGIDAPVDVELGETTLDEMCLGVFGVLYE